METNEIIFQQEGKNKKKKILMSLSENYKIQNNPTMKNNSIFKMQKIFKSITFCI